MRKEFPHLFFRGVRGEAILMVTYTFDVTSTYMCCTHVCVMGCGEKEVAHMQQNNELDLKRVLHICIAGIVIGAAFLYHMIFVTKQIILPEKTMLALSQALAIISMITMRILYLIITLWITYHVLKVIRYCIILRRNQKDMRYVKLIISEESYERLDNIEESQLNLMRSLYLAKRPKYSFSSVKEFFNSTFFKGQVIFHDVRIKRKKENGKMEYLLLFGYPKQRENQVIQALYEAYPRSNFEKVEDEQLQQYVYTYELYSKKSQSFARNYSPTSHTFTNQLFDSSLGNDIVIQTIFSPTKSSETLYEKRVDRKFAEIKKAQVQDRRMLNDQSMMDTDINLTPEQLTNKKDLQSRRQTKIGTDVIFDVSIIIAGNNESATKSVVNKFVQSTMHVNQFKTKRLRAFYKQKWSQQLYKVIHPQLHSTPLTGSELSTIIRPSKLGE